MYLVLGSLPANGSNKTSDVAVAFRFMNSITSRVLN